MTSEGGANLRELIKYKSALLYKIRTGLTLDLLAVLLIIAGLKSLPVVVHLTISLLFLIISVSIFKLFGQLQDCRRQISNFDNTPPLPSNRATKY